MAGTFMPMGVPQAHEVLRRNKVTEPSQWNSETRIAKLGMKDKTVGAGLGLSKRGRGKQRPYRFGIGILNGIVIMGMNQFGGRHGVVARES